MGGKIAASDGLRSDVRRVLWREREVCEAQKREQWLMAGTL
jgi:hypothetical protein